MAGHLGQAVLPGEIKVELMPLLFSPSESVRDYVNPLPFPLDGHVFRLVVSLCAALPF